MPQPSTLTLVDVVVAVLVVAAVAVVLGRRRSLVAAAGAAVGAALVGWLAVVALSIWAPPAVASAADESRLLQLLPPPHQAVDQARELTRTVGSHLDRSPVNPGESH